jgi:hypothetical protein
MRLKPWPSDALIVIAAYRGTENAATMEGPRPCHCRDCGAELVADTRSIRRALALPQRRGRPVEFLCLFCKEAYAMQGVRELWDSPGGILE